MMSGATFVMELTRLKEQCSLSIPLGNTTISKTVKAGKRLDAGKTLSAFSLLVTCVE